MKLRTWAERFMAWHVGLIIGITFVATAARFAFPMTLTNVVINFVVYFVALTVLGVVIFRRGRRVRRLAQARLLCPRCLYVLDGIDGGACPECGRPFEPAEVRAYWDALFAGRVRITRFRWR